MIPIKIISVLFIMFIILFSVGTTRALDSDAWVALQYYHSHNEFTVAAREEVTGHARYGFEIYFEIEHKGWFGFISSLGVAGRNIPQKMYTMDFDYIATYLRYGAGYRFDKHVELAIIHGRWVGNVRESNLWNTLQLKITFW